MVDQTKVVVVGGGGFYGRYLVADLVRFTAAEIIVVSRNPPSEWAEPGRVRSIACDLMDLAGLEHVINGAQVVINCAGPFENLPLNPLRAAIHTRANYVDIAESRTFLREIKKLAEPIRQANIAVMTGMSVAPAMEGLFANMVKERFDTLSSVRTFAAPDTRKHRGTAMFHTMLMGVGRPFWQPKDGEARLVYGWTEPEWVEFPAPLGKRLMYLVLEMSDLDLLPELLGIKTVEFKVGTEWPFLNRLLGMAANTRKITGHPNWERFTIPVRMFSWLVGRLGKDEGGAIFEFQGMRNGILITERIAIIARKDGGLIPSVLASMAARRLIANQIEMKGIVPIHQWITPTELVTELRARGLDLWWQSAESKEWQELDLNQF